MVAYGVNFFHSDFILPCFYWTVQFIQSIQRLKGLSMSNILSITKVPSHACLKQPYFGEIWFREKGKKLCVQAHGNFCNSRSLTQLSDGPDSHIIDLIMRKGAHPLTNVNFSKWP